MFQSPPKFALDRPRCYAKPRSNFAMRDLLDPRGKKDLAAAVGKFR